MRPAGVAGRQGQGSGRDRAVLASAPCRRGDRVIRALIALHVAVALFGFAGLFGKWLDLPPALIVFGRTLIAAAVLAAVALARRESARPTTALALNGLILAVHWLAFFAAIQRSSVAIGLLGFASFPLFVLLLDRLVEGRRWARSELATALLVTAGLVVLLPSFNPGDRTLQGLALGLVSGATFALLAVRSRRHVVDRSPVTIALWQNVFAALVLLPWALAFAASGAGLTPRDLLLLAVLGILCTAGAHTLFIASLRRLSAHTASVVTGLEPVYGIALAAGLLGEIPTLRTLVGAVLIVGAAMIATRRGA